MIDRIGVRRGRSHAGAGDISVNCPLAPVQANFDSHASRGVLVRQVRGVGLGQGDVDLEPFVGLGLYIP